MARSQLTYAAAVKLLAGGDVGIGALDRLLGGILLSAAPFTGGGSLALLDAKSEGVRLLRDLTDRAPGRIRASKGRAHYELIEAAHTVLVLSAVFDAFAEAAGPAYEAAALSDEDKLRVGDRTRRPELVDTLRDDGIPLPSATRGFAETLQAIHVPVVRLVRHTATFLAGLAAFERVSVPDLLGVADRALELYRERYVRLAVDVPEFGFWMQLDEHAATRTEVRGQTAALHRLAELLERTVDAGAPGSEVERRLARLAAQVLDKPLWRADTPAPGGLRFPTVEQGFVSPRFRHAVADAEARPADESWWARQAQHEDLVGFLAAYFADPESTQRPLVLLGHPGAGKSLLTEVLAARLPAHAYTTVRVPLRQVDADAEIHQQIESAVERAAKERITWGELTRASATTKVVLLDGFDELVQATGVAQSGYIERAARFQQDEWAVDRPVVLVVTSRTLVMDRSRIPDGAVLLKLESFDEHQVHHWITAWNAANADTAGFRPLTAAELLHHGELGRQPLLLLMLAVYAAERGVARLDDAELSTVELYRLLLTTFVRRQVRDKAAADLGETEFDRLERDGLRDLAVAAFAMFNRGQQYVSEDDLERDLEALQPDGRGGRGRPSLGEPLTRARRTVAAFFFVHVAQADDDRRAPGRRSYEFLHATFGEYLVAAHTVERLVELADDWRRTRGRSYAAELDDRLLRALLSHQPLAKGEQILPFLAQLLARLDPAERAGVRGAVLDLFHDARGRVEADRYEPTPFDAVTRLAAYTGNLVLLAGLCDSGGIDVEEITGRAGGPSLTSTVRLWRCLDPESQNALFNALRRTGDRWLVGKAELRVLALAEAELIGDTGAEAVLRAGRRAWRLPVGGAEVVLATPFQRDFHEQLLHIATGRWPVPPLGRMLPYDEQRYAVLADAGERADELISPASADLLSILLVDDGPYMARELLVRLVEVCVRRPESLGSVPMLWVLALRWPFLARRPAVYKALQDTSLAALPYELLQATERALRPTELDIVGMHLAQELETTGTEVTRAEVTPSMVRTLSFTPLVMPSVLRSLRAFGALAWSQVAPADLLEAVTAARTAATGAHGDELVEVVRNYLEHRADDPDRPSVAALHAFLTDAG